MNAQRLFLQQRLSSLALMAATALCALYLTYEGMLYWQQRWIQDDAYISFRFAKNLVAGHGLTYNPGQYVEGYTNFLWVIISSIPLAFGYGDPIDFMHGFSLLLWIYTYALFFLIAVKSLPFGRWAAPFATAALAINYSFNQWYFSGMECPLESSLALTVIYFASTAHTKRKFFALGFASSLLLLTRMDTAFMVAGACTVAFAAYPHILSRHGVRLFSSFLIPVLAVFGTYFSWRMWYYEDFYPNTYYAKLGYVTFYERGMDYFSTFCKVYPYLLIAIPGFIVATLFGNTIQKKFASASFFASVLHIFYVIRLGGDFMEWRFLVPIFPFLYLLTFACVTIIAHYLYNLIVKKSFSLDRIRMGVTISTTAAALFLPLLVYRQPLTQLASDLVSEGQEEILSLKKYAEHPFLWREIGKQLKELLPKDIAYATPAAGMIPFFSEHRVIDTLGLTDRVIAKNKAHYIETGRERVGHEYEEVDPSELRSRNLDFIITWPGIEPRMLITAYAVPPAFGTELLSINIFPEKWIDITVLTPGKEIWKILKKSPLIESYQEREKGIQQVTLAAVVPHLTEDGHIITEGCTQISTEVHIPLPTPLTLRGFETYLDYNDRYVLSFMHNGKIIHDMEIMPADQNPKFIDQDLSQIEHMQFHQITFDAPIKEVDKIIISPQDGDWNYTLCGFLPLLTR